MLAYWDDMLGGKRGLRRSAFAILIPSALLLNHAVCH